MNEPLHRYVLTPTGVVAVDTGYTVADLEVEWYLVPVAGGRCHLNSNGRPLCGVALAEPHETSRWKCGGVVCSACEIAENALRKPQGGPQHGGNELDGLPMFAEVQA